MKTRTQNNRISLLAIATLLLVASAARAQDFDPDDYIKPHFDAGQREIGFRLGVPILDWEIRKQPAQQPWWTEYNELEVHGFHLCGIGEDNLTVGLSVRWKQFEAIPIVGGRWKRAETNCDGAASIRLFVTDDHRLARDKPSISVQDCDTSGIGLEQFIDYVLQGLTWVVSGGSTSVGLFDILAGLGELVYNFDAFFNDEHFNLSDPVHYQIILNERIPFIRKIYELDDLYIEFFLKAVKYDPKGLWLIFGWNDNLDGDVLPLAGMVSL